MTAAASHTPRVADSSVLIDYLETEESVLALSVQHVAPIFVPLPIVQEEVSQLDEDVCERLSLGILEPTVAQADWAAAGNGIGFFDRLCFILARDYAYASLTNDKSLRRECLAAGIPVVRGLQLMVELVTRGHLPANEARSIAQAISAVNPYITAEIVRDFDAALESPGPRTSPRGSRS